MLINYLAIYLVFIILVSAIFAFLLLRVPALRIRAIVSAMIFLFLVPGLGVYFYVTYFNPIPEIVVPDVRGRLLSDAQEELDSLNLKALHSGSIFDPQIAEGGVVSQQPEQGIRVKRGRVISLITSSGKNKIVVPNLLGRSLAQAEAVLRAKNLLLGEVEEDLFSPVEINFVLSQNPLPEEEVEVGSLVNITISASQEALFGVEEKDKNKDKDKEKGGFWLW